MDYLDSGVRDIFTLLVIPVVTVQMLAVFFIASLLQSGAKPMDVGHAVFGVLIQAFGIVLMTVGGLPAVYAVITGSPLHSLTYFGLLLVFASGGILYLLYDKKIQSIDAKATVVPIAILFFSWKLIGLLIFVIASLSLLLQLLLMSPHLPLGWWTLHVLAILYGLLLSWCTRIPNNRSLWAMLRRKKR